MQIFVTIKALGKRKPVLAPEPHLIPDTTASLRQLLTAVVESEVARYNSREPGAQLIPYLTHQQLEDQAITGKVSFGRIYSEQKADPQKAIQNALQCWQDGLVRVFMEAEELTDLDTPLTIFPGTTFTFIRLTFLTGSLW